VVLLVVTSLSVGAGARSVGAQEPTTTSAAEVPPGDIIPRPNTGAAPEDAGDRGGALQLAVLLIVIVAVVGGVANLARQARRARAEGGR
jgi:hypothetical protein